jgi:hypothetical protein
MISGEYLRFNTSINLLSEDEKKWWERHLIDAKRAYEVAGTEDLYSIRTGLPIEVERFKQIVWVDYCDVYGFDHSFEKDSNENSCIWFQAGEGCGNITHLLEIVCCFFKDMRPNGPDIFVLTWACTCDCDKLQIDTEFHGSTAVATKDGIGWCGLEEQLDIAKTNIQDPMAYPSKTRDS